MQPFIGQICFFGFPFAPRDWAVCDGKPLNPGAFSALFSLLGTIYGGDGRTSFNLPDFRGRLPVGAGSGPGIYPTKIGERSGWNQMTLTIGNLPAHTHSLVGAGIGYNEEGDSGDGNTLAVPARNQEDAEETLPLNIEKTGVTGSNAAFDLTNPYQCVNICIALLGVYPSRN